MAILNFPINPNHNDNYTANGIDYLFDSDTTSWEVQPNLGYTGSAGFTGSKGAGFTGSRGSLGYTGSSGFTGSQGLTGGVGYTGSSQSQGIRYAYDDNLTTTGALTGEIRFNNATLGSATAIGIHVTDANTNNQTDYFTQLDNFGDAANNFFGYIQIRPADTSSGITQIFKIESVFSLGGSVLTATVSSISGSLSLTDTDQILITFIPAVQGAIGYTGSQGVIGYTGSKGDQGVIGYTGSQGIIGYTGSQGVIGYTGSRGVIGYTGSKGDQGVIGYTGSKGDKGYTGSRGVIGYTGSRGVIGYTGSKGNTGTGNTGYTGSKGNNGGIGYTGSAAAGGTGLAIAMAMIFG